MSRSPSVPRSPGQNALRSSVVVGLVLLLLVLGAGAYLASTQQKTFTAESVLVVLPQRDLDDATTAAFYETLSRGQIVGTFAEVANNPTVQQQAVSTLAIPASAQSGLSTVVSVVPDTSVILVRTTADDAATAETVADGVATAATTSLSQLSDAFRTQIVHKATGTAVSSGLSPLLVLGLAVVAAIVLGVALQQAVYHLLRARSAATLDATDARADDAALATETIGGARRSRSATPSPAGRG